MKHQLSICMHRHMIDRGMPQGIAERKRQKLRLGELRQKTVQNFGLDLPLFFLGL